MQHTTFYIFCLSLSMKSRVIFIMSSVSKSLPSQTMPQHAREYFPTSARQDRASTQDVDSGARGLAFAIPLLWTWGRRRAEFFHLRIARQGVARKAFAGSATFRRTYPATGLSARRYRRSRLACPPKADRCGWLVLSARRPTGLASCRGLQAHRPETCRGGSGRGAWSFPPSGNPQSRC